MSPDSLQKAAGVFCVILQAEVPTCHWTRLHKGAWANGVDCTSTSILTTVMVK